MGKKVVLVGVLLLVLSSLSLACNAVEEVEEVQEGPEFYIWCPSEWEKVSREEMQVLQEAEIEKYGKRGDKVTYSETLLYISREGFPEMPSLQVSRSPRGSESVKDLLLFSEDWDIEGTAVDLWGRTSVLWTYQWIERGELCKGYTLGVLGDEFIWVVYVSASVDSLDEYGPTIDKILQSFRILED